MAQAVQFVANPQVRSQPAAKIKSYLSQAMGLTAPECSAVLSRAKIYDPDAKPAPAQAPLTCI